MVKRFALFGIPIHISPSWFVIFGLVAWSVGARYYPYAYPGLSWSWYTIMGLISSLMLFVCIVLHEFGHSLVARYYGLPVACVTLFLFGGVAQVAGTVKRPGIEFLVAVAGPLVSLGLALLCYWGYPKIAIHSQVSLGLVVLLRYLMVVNAAVMLFNLLPAFPLDGGRILRSLLWALTGNVLQATRIASMAGVICGLGIIVLGLWDLTQGRMIGGLWYALLGSFLYRSAMASYRQAKYWHTAE